MSDTNAPFRDEELRATFEPLPSMFYNVPKIPKLLAALSKAQGAYEPIKKDKQVSMRLKNKATGNYDGATITFKYADLASILEATRKPLSDNGLTFNQPIEQVGDQVWLNSILAHEDGGMIMARIQIYPETNDVRALGTAITYARRYAAGPLLGTSSEDDADDHDGEGTGKEAGGGGGGEDGRDWREEHQPTRRTIPQKDAADNKPPPAPPAPEKEKKQEPEKITAVTLEHLQKQIKALKLTPAQTAQHIKDAGGTELSVDGLSVDQAKTLSANLRKLIG